jgi:hypothetical protein
VTAPVVTPYRSGQQPGHDGFGQLLHAEWTKFRTVRGWAAGMAAAVLAMVLLGLFAAGNASIACQIGGPGAPTRTGRSCLLPVPTGPRGELVRDSFYFVHRPLSGNGTLTARMTSLSGRYGDGLAPPAAGQGPPMPFRGLQPWSKAGIMIKASTRAGAAYAALMLTGGHGLRMQDDFTQDKAGPAVAAPAVSPRWLRLARSGGTVTGYESADGSHWATAGTVRLPGLPRTVQVGLFAASPEHVVTSPSAGGPDGQTGPSQVTAVFDQLSVAGRAAGSGWAGTGIEPSNAPSLGTFHRSAGTLTVTGSGDIAPVVPAAGAGPGPTVTIEQHLVGAFAGLIAVAAVLALAAGSVLRRSAAAVTVVIVAVVLPYVLSVASVLPAGAADWLLRLTPAAAFAIQQSVPQYPQVTASYTPANGFFPLALWAGFAVLCGYTAVALGLAVFLLRRRDA